jgi:hypothetical protein
MAISKPGGRFGHPTADPGREKKARSGGGYDGSPQVSFNLKATGIDAPAVSPKAPVHVGKAPMPNTNLTHGSVNHKSQ